MLKSKSTSYPISARERILLGLFELEKRAPNRAVLEADLLAWLHNHNLEPSEALSLIDSMVRRYPQPLEILEDTSSEVGNGHRYLRLLHFGRSKAARRMASLSDHA